MKMKHTLLIYSDLEYEIHVCYFGVSIWIWFILDVLITNYFQFWNEYALAFMLINFLAHHFAFFVVFIDIYIFFFIYVRFYDS